MQAAARVLGNDQTIAFCGAAGSQFQLNVMMPVMADAALESVRLLAGATPAFTTAVWPAWKRTPSVCRARSSGAPRWPPAESLHRLRAGGGLAKEAMATGKTVRQLARERSSCPKSNWKGPRSLADDPPGVSGRRRGEDGMVSLAVSPSALTLSFHSATSVPDARRFLDASCPRHGARPWRRWRSASDRSSRAAAICRTPKRPPAN